MDSKHFLYSKTLWTNVAFILAAIINAYIKKAGFVGEVTADQVTTALAIAAPLANNLLRTQTTQAIHFKTPASETTPAQPPAAD